MMVRNPAFEEWSPAAQPAGYPERIVWRLGVEDDDAVSAVEKGRADWTADGPPRERITELQTQYADQVHVYSQAGTRRSAGARSESGAAIPRDSEVVVTRYEKGLAWVRPWEELAQTEEVAK